MSLIHAAKPLSIKPIITIKNLLITIKNLFRLFKQFRLIHEIELREIKQQKYDEALRDIVQLLLKKNKIYLSPVRIKNGRNMTIQDCVFFGLGNNTCLYIDSNETQT